MENNYDIIIKAYGGGLSGQAEAILWFCWYNWFLKLILYQLLVILLLLFYKIYHKLPKIDLRKLAISKIIYKNIDDNQKKVFRLQGLLTRKSTCKERRSSNYSLTKFCMFLVITK